MAPEPAHLNPRGSPQLPLLLNAAATFALLIGVQFGIIWLSVRFKAVSQQVKSDLLNALSNASSAEGSSLGNVPGGLR